MNLHLTMLALAMALPVASAQAPASDLVGIHTRITTIGGGVGYLDAGEKVTNELIVHEDPATPGQLKAYVSSVATNGISCSAHGKVSDVTATGFTVVDSLMGMSCELTIKREKSGMKITAAKGCNHFCGHGGSFSKANYKRVCNTVSPQVVEELETRQFAIGPDYGPACAKAN